VNIYLSNSTANTIVQILEHHKHDGTFPDQRVTIDLFLNAYEQALEELEAKVTDEHKSFASKIVNTHE
jgi:hypothetical protein